MKYIGRPDFQHGTAERLGVLVVNLGTPEAPETAPVRKYLAQFLSDPAHYRSTEMAVDDHSARGDSANPAVT